MMTNEIKQLFKERRTSPLQVAREIGVTHTYMYDLLSGHQRNPKRRKQVAKVLRIRLDHLARVCGWTDVAQPASVQN